MRECTDRPTPLGKLKHAKPIVSAWEHYRPQMGGLGLHYYTRDRFNYTSATDFGEELWFEYMKRTLFIEELIIKHSEIMDQYDPMKQVGLIIDEWGTWYKTEPGTNPAFLYQQNTLRDALVAGINLNVFNNHCDRVKMANIAQMINVLQSMILTDGEKMIVTPSYHVFEMYKVHQDATLLPTQVVSSDYTYGEESLPTVNVSASRDQSDRIHLSLCNLNPSKDETVTCNFDGPIGISKVSARILTAESMQHHNTFDQPEQVKPEGFKGVEVVGGESIRIVLPAKSVVVVEIQG
jgi:alpha-N-arabinofuranosidase